MNEQLDKFCQMLVSEFINGVNSGKSKTELRKTLNDYLKKNRN